MEAEEEAAKKNKEKARLKAGSEEAEAGRFRSGIMSHHHHRSLTAPLRCLSN